MKFLHIADIHLGCTRYGLAESPRDFFEAWRDVIERYAVGEKVDFVIMCGDFFHKRAVPPETMNYAVEGLTILRDAGIPVVAIEGNHDQKHTDSEFSWLRSLSRWGLVTLLEPTRSREGTSKALTLNYEPWDEAAKKGGFIDIGRARIFGSEWFGASGNWGIPMLTAAIKQNRREGAFHILMLHTDVEGHQVHPIPALSIDALRELKQAVEYVGLGHTHKHYEIDNWAFNPGSIEITNINEFYETRGAFVVEVDDQYRVSARHLTDYRHRPFQRVSFQVTDISEPKRLTYEVVRQFEKDAGETVVGQPQRVIDITLRGRLGFPNSQLEVREIRDEIKRIANALHVRVKNQTVPAEYLERLEPADDAGRERLERRVIEDLVLRDSRYKSRQSDLTDAVIGAKRMALGDDEPEKIAEFIALKVKTDR